MKKVAALWILALSIASEFALAQQLTGQWQGTLRSRDLRYVLKISKTKQGRLSAVFFSIDRTPDGFPVNVIALNGSTLKFSVNQVNGSYEGRLSADGKSISGTWTQGPPSPLDFQLTTGKTAWPTDISPHKVLFVSVEKNIKLEVLDWGGNGPPLIFLAGNGDTAHVFDRFAPLFATNHRVYGVTRRGFGASSAPPPTEENYAADRLGDDVLGVIATLKLDRPVLAGHSIAGEELSSVGSRHPERVAGLIYLDAVSSYSWYDGLQGSFEVDTNELRKKLDQIDPVTAGTAQQEIKPLVEELLHTTLPQYERDLQFMEDVFQAFPSRPAATPALPIALQTRISDAIVRGERKYTNISGPVLAIFATSPKPTSGDAAVLKAWTNSAALITARANALEAGVPGAHVVRLQNADHYVFRSNEGDVRREMNEFMASLR
jgi:pimeloyl-ACP methyl ester carboxylesterase